MSKFGLEKLGHDIADSILEFVNSAIDNQLDNLDLTDKIDSAINESDLESKIDTAVSDFDFSNVIDSDLIRSNVDLDSIFQEWIDSKFEKQIQPAIDSIREDMVATERNLDESNLKVFQLTSRLDCLERDFNRILSDKLSPRPNTLSKVWNRIRALFAKIGG